MSEGGGTYRYLAFYYLSNTNCYRRRPRACLLSPKQNQCPRQSSHKGQHEQITPFTIIHKKAPLSIDQRTREHMSITRPNKKEQTEIPPQNARLRRRRFLSRRGDNAALLPSAIFTASCTISISLTPPSSEKSPPRRRIRYASSK
jgi:hypothetical protein